MLSTTLGLTSWMLSKHMGVGLEVHWGYYSGLLWVYAGVLGGNHSPYLPTGNWIDYHNIGPSEGMT